MGRTPETESLRTKALKGGVYLTVRHGAMVVLGLLGALLLTRIVGPANYGLYNAAYGVFGCLLRFLGVRADVADILRASDVFVLSSRWEGNPMSVMEAMAAGLPVVSTAVGGVPELVQEGATGLLVPSEDTGALACALQALVDDPARRQAMGAAARQHAIAHFDIRHTVRMYEELYERLLAKGAK